MTPPTQLVTLLRGTTAAGSKGVAIDCNVLGPVTRTVGLSGDRLNVVVPRDQIPGTWDMSKGFDLLFDNFFTPPTNIITLGGYRLIRRRPITQGEALTVPGVVGFAEEVFELVTVISRLRDGRSGRVTAGTLNRVNKDGLVNDAHPDYKTNQELADILLDAIGLAHDPAPAGLDTAIDGATAIGPPGPLDWSNANAIDELDALLARIGWTASLNNAGSKLIVHNLTRAGQEYSLPALITDNAEPYELLPAPGARGQKFLVTSGRTKSIILTTRTLEASGPHEALEWVGFDSRIGDWLNAAEWATLYPSEVPPGDIDAWNDGPRGAAQDRVTETFARLFTAVRVGAAEYDQVKDLVMPIGEWAFADGKSLSGTMAVVWGRVAQDNGTGQFVNVPEGAMDDQVRIEGVNVVPTEGVFVLPRDAAFVRMDPGSGGTYGEAIALDGDDLVVAFAHEANTGDPEVDHFLALFEIDDTGGSITATQLSEAAAIDALDDPEVVKVEAPFLRRVLIWEHGDADPEPVDGSSLDDALKEIAEQLVLARAAGLLAESGQITLKGLFNVEPGITHASVSSVTWDIDGVKTYTSINTHEAPRSFFDAQQLAAQRSLAAGLRRLSVGGSSVSLSEVRGGSTPTAGGGGQAVHAEDKPAGRGAEMVRKTATPAGHPAPTPDVGAPGFRGVGVLIVQIRDDPTVIGGGPGRWKYEWDPVSIGEDGAYTVVAGAKSSDDLGLAYNLAELANTGSGIEGHGVDVDALPGTFETQPIRGDRVVMLYGPFPGATGPTWYFSATNAVDGECSESL